MSCATEIWDLGMQRAASIEPLFRGAEECRDASVENATCSGKLCLLHDRFDDCCVNQRNRSVDGYADVECECTI